LLTSACLNTTFGSTDTSLKGLPGRQKNCADVINAPNLSGDNTLRAKSAHLRVRTAKGAMKIFSQLEDAATTE
jgi:hypothetical protein